MFHLQNSSSLQPSILIGPEFDKFLTSIDLHFVPSSVTDVMNANPTTGAEAETILSGSESVSPCP